MQPMFKYSDILRVEYEPNERTAFNEALSNGETQVFVVYRSEEGVETRVDVTKPVCIEKDGKTVFLKIPNPCNHQLEISYIEAANANLARALLLPKGVVVPQYEVGELALESPFTGKSMTPCCLIEALEGYIPFGECGTDHVADPSKIVFERLTPIQQTSRSRRQDILFAPQFAAVCVVNKFLRNNDCHQENFGTVTIGGRNSLALIDFDMCAMSFLVEHGYLGPSNAPFFTPEDGYTDDRRYSAEFNMESFPIPVVVGTPVADNDVSQWCPGFIQGLNLSPTKGAFREAKESMFKELRGLNPVFIIDTIRRTVPPRVYQRPEIERLFANLTQYYIVYLHRLALVIDAQSPISPEPDGQTCVSNSSLGAFPPATPVAIVGGSSYRPPSALVVSALTQGSMFATRSFSAVDRPPAHSQYRPGPSPLMAEVTFADLQSAAENFLANALKM